MPVISIDQLHEETDKWVRSAQSHGEVIVTDGGNVVARIVPELRKPALTPEENEVPYFARVKRSPEMWALMNKPLGGTDVTDLISQGRDDPES